MIDDQIIGDVVWSLWTPIWPGRNGYWRQHSLIRNIVGCDGGTDTGTRRLEDWVGKSLDEIDRGGPGALEGRHLSADRGQAKFTEVSERHERLDSAITGAAVYADTA